MSEFRSDHRPSADELAVQWLDGEPAEFTPDATARLSANDQRVLADQLLVDALLEYVYADGQARDKKQIDRLIQELPERRPKAGLPMLLGVLQTGVSMAQRPVALLLIVAAFVGVGLSAWWFRREAPAIATPQVVATQNVATMVRSFDAKWDGAVSLSDGAAVPGGQALQLTHGAAEFIMHSGVRLLVEAPAELVVEPTGVAAPQGTVGLKSGRLCAVVPPQAVGFEVITPTARVTDHGTVFGVHAGAHATEVHVFKGEVETQSATSSPTGAATPAAASMKLRSGEAARLSAGAPIARLTAANAFAFRRELLEDLPARTILADDFESIPANMADRDLGGWRSYYRKGKEKTGVQRVRAIDLFAKETTDKELAAVLGHRVLELIDSLNDASFPNTTFARRLGAVDWQGAKKLILQFDINLQRPGTQPKITLQPGWDLRLAPEIVLAYEPQPTAPKGEWKIGSWYRVRTVIDLHDNAPGAATLHRAIWKPGAGWMSDLMLKIPGPAQSAPVAGGLALQFGQPQASRAGGAYLLDNIRLEIQLEE